MSQPMMWPQSPVEMMTMYRRMTRPPLQIVVSASTYDWYRQWEAEQPGRDRQAVARERFDFRYQVFRERKRRRR